MRHRSKPRVGVKYPVQFLGDSTVGKGALVNLSGPGCAVASDTSLEPGAYVSLQIKVPKVRKPVVVAVALVRWVKKGQFGLEFIRYGKGGREHLERIVAGGKENLIFTQTDEDIWAD